jgi:hypothetical protein
LFSAKCECDEAALLAGHESEDVAGYGTGTGALAGEAEAVVALVARHLVATRVYGIGEDPSMATARSEGVEASAGRSRTLQGSVDPEASVPPAGMAEGDVGMQGRV